MSENESYLLVLYIIFIMFLRWFISTSISFRIVCSFRLHTSLSLSTFVFSKFLISCFHFPFFIQHKICCCAHLTEAHIFFTLLYFYFFILTCLIFYIQWFFAGSFFFYFHFFSHISILVRISLFIVHFIFLPFRLLIFHSLNFDVLNLFLICDVILF